jgi:tRNA threonylcarbamoyladenosine biosynthesis protein TsaB
VITLVLDASTYRGTVAVFRDSSAIASADATMRGAHAEALMPAVADTLSRASVTVEDLDRVICGEGPGSFTSLRIAGSIAKGLCLGAGIPLYGVSSLALVAAAADVTSGTFVATIDALRDEWYVATFRGNGSRIEQESPVVIVPKSELVRFASEIGPIIGAATDGRMPDAAACASLFAEIEKRGPVDLDRWEPTYGRLAEAQVKWEAAHGRPLKA